MRMRNAKHLFVGQKDVWLGMRDSNPRNASFKGRCLTTWLIPNNLNVGHYTINPATNLPIYISAVF